ncbi:imidazolonepropionase [Bdellovibrio sp. HCB337]|uniref:imidazolonepropionase n=1 Tax=Bdellovibrio sp. HCB337 TaxID=3394358 RepID=UPI0039A4D150
MTNMLVTNIGELLTLAPAMKKEGRKVTEHDLGLAKNQAIYIEKGRVSWIGSQKQIPKHLAKQKKLKEFSAKGLTVLPGLVECHTHLVFAGSRAAEFELRNQGMSYQEIAKRGGGILSTMKQTREMSVKALKGISQERVNEFISQGVTTLEIKSGYALDEKNEIKCLKVAKSLEGPRIVTTFLGAHAKPPEYDSYKAYLDFLQKKVLPQVKKQKLSNRVDVYVEKGFFSQEDSREFLKAAQGMGFEVLLHADQLTLSGGADLGVELNALSGDHLIQIEEPQVQKLAKSQVTCVLLPAADLYMKCKYPPARKLIDAGARVALATDFNPGTSPTQDVNLVGLLARLEMKMTLPEVISAYTVGASYALKLQSEVGSLEVGKHADFLCTDKDWQQLFYSIGERSPTFVYKSGELIY